MANVRYTAKQKRAMKKMSPAKARAFKKMLARSPAIETIRPKRRRAKRNAAPKRKTTRRARPNRALVPGASRQAAYEKGHARIFGGAKAGRPRKSDFVASQMARGRSKKQAEAAWKISWGKKHAAAARKRAKTPRTYGKGKIRSLKARIGGKSVHTYMYRTPKGSVRHIPEYAVLGYPSAKALSLARKTAKGEAAYRKKKSSLTARRDRAAERAAKRIRAGRGIFTPNPGGEVLSYDEWSEKMKRNPKRKTRKKRKGQTRKQRAASLRNLKKARASRKKKGKKTTKRKATKRRGKLTKAQRSAAAKKGWRGRRRKGTARKTTKRRTAKRKTTKRAKSLTITMRANASPAQIRAAKRNIRKAQAARWKRNASMRYEANPAEAYVEDLKGAVKLGAIALTGYMAHRALSKLVNDYALSKIGALQTGSAAKWRDVIAGLLVAAVGVPAAVKVVPRESAAAGAGIAASLLHQILITALTEAGQPGAVAYLSAYPDASSPAWPGIGSYYTFKPREVFPASGMGEYYGLGPGPLQTQQLTQAAAGFRPMQAAAGMGALVTQAAAGQGEYLAYNAQANGNNYEQVPTAPVPMAVDDGVMPNLYSAEQELNVMEAAAGIGQAEIPYQSTVNPLQLEVPIGDEPRGSRSGIFEGGGGIFG